MMLIQYGIHLLENLKLEKLATAKATNRLHHPPLKLKAQPAECAPVRSADAGRDRRFRDTS